MARKTLEQYYATPGTLIEDYSSGTYLSAADSALFKAIFDKMYKGRLIGAITDANFKRRWEKVFFEGYSKVKAKRANEALQAGITSMKQTQTSTVNAFPQNGSTPIASGFRSAETETETNVSPETLLAQYEREHGRPDTITDFVKQFSKCFYAFYEEVVIDDEA